MPMAVPVSMPVSMIVVMAVAVGQGRRVGMGVVMFVVGITGIVVMIMVRAFTGKGMARDFFHRFDPNCCLGDQQGCSD